jgi:hypothetical protein
MISFWSSFTLGEAQSVGLSVQGELTNVNEENITRVTREEWAKLTSSPP